MDTLSFPVGNDRVLIEVADHVAHVRLNRPDKRNGLDHAMFHGLVDAGVHLKRLAGLRVVILSGEGPAFCAGLDFKSFIAGGPAQREELLSRTTDSPANIAQRAAWVWQEVGVPVIAALHGPCLGGGLQIALGADIRLAAADTQMSVMEVVYGLIPDMSITRTLSRIVSLDVAKELTFTGRRIDANEALSLGLITRLVDDPLAAAREMAALIASRSPDAVRAAKSLWNSAPELDDAAALHLETALQLPLLGSANQLEAVMASMQKRAPRFVDPEPE